MPRVAHGRDITRNPAVWRVCGGVGRREPYNLTLESKTYYTQNDDSMSDNMKKVQELMVTGFSGNLNFERDFVAEGIEMLNRFELQ